jgi:hypothetical protein
MILGLTGKMGAGKNEAARRLALISPLPVVEVSYAKKLKESVAALFGVTVEALEESKNMGVHSARVSFRAMLTEGYVAKTLTVREFLQRYGTEAHRDVFGQDFWLDAALPLTKSEEDLDGQLRDVGPFYDDALYVVTDCRFENEAKRIHQLGGRIVRLIGPNEATGDHPSETAELPYDWKILNTERDDDFAYLDSQLHTLLTVAGVA